MSEETAVAIEFIQGIADRMDEAVKEKKRAIRRLEAQAYVNSLTLKLKMEVKNDSSN